MPKGTNDTHAVVEPPKPSRVGRRWLRRSDWVWRIGLGAWMFLRPRTSEPPPAPVAHEPVSVLIADFDNQAKDPSSPDPWSRH